MTGVKRLGAMVIASLNNFKTVYINIQTALNSNVALQDEDVTTVTFLVKGKKYMHI